MRIIALAILVASITACRSTGSAPEGSAVLGASAGDVGEDGKHCFHAALKNAIALGTTALSFTDFKDWQDKNGGGISISFDPTKKDEKHNGDVDHEIKHFETDDDGISMDEYFADYKIAVKVRDDKMQVKQRFSTSNCSSGQKPDVSPKIKPSDKRLTDDACSFEATRQAVSLMIGQFADDKVVEAWAETKGGGVKFKNPKPYSSLAEQVPPEDVAYLVNVEIEKMEIKRRVFVELKKSGCDLVSASLSTPDQDLMNDDL